MAVLVVIENDGEKVSKRSKEAVYFGSQVANQLGAECVGLSFGSPGNAEDLGQYGASKVLNISGDKIPFSTTTYTDMITKVVDQIGAFVLVLNHSSMGKSLAGGLAIRLKAGLVSGVVGMHVDASSFVMETSVYSGKAIAKVEVTTGKKVVTIQNNAFPARVIGESCPVESISISVPEMLYDITEVKKQEGQTPLPEAELVVSGGRGFKGPENWNILLDLANALGAATACSRPVADTGWRPHHEHVGQTGVAIRPNLYIAIGISGAIQHLGGVK